MLTKGEQQPLSTKGEQQNKLLNLQQQIAIAIPTRQLAAGAVVATPTILARAAAAKGAGLHPEAVSDALPRGRVAMDDAAVLQKVGK